MNDQPVDDLVKRAREQQNSATNERRKALQEKFAYGSGGQEEGEAIKRFPITTRQVFNLM